MTETKNRTSPARQRLLETAARLFGEQGIRSVGIDTLISEAQVAKMTLYRHFESKDDLIMAFLENRHQQCLQGFEKAKQEPAGQQLATYLSQYAQALSQRDFCRCAHLTVLIEFPELHHPAHQLVQRHKQEVVQQLAQLAEHDHLNHPLALAAHLQLVMHGAMMQRQLYGPDWDATAFQQLVALLLDKARN